MKKKLIMAASLALVVVVLVVVLVACQAAQDQEQEPQGLSAQQTAQPATTDPTPTHTPETAPESETPDHGLTFESFNAPMFAAENLTVYSKPDTASNRIGQVSKNGFMIIEAVSSDGIWAKVEDTITDSGIISGYVLFDQLLFEAELNQQQQPEPEITPEPEVTPEPEITPEPKPAKQQPSGGTGGTSGGTAQQPQGGGTGGSSGGSGGGTGDIPGERVTTSEEEEENQRILRELQRQAAIANGLDPDATQPVDDTEIWIENPRLE